MAKPPERITYATRLDRYNDRHERARKRGKRWANKGDHHPWLVDDGTGYFKPPELRPA